MPELVEKMACWASTAVHLAQEENRRKGIPNVYCLNGKIVWQLPDGTVTMQEPPDMTNAELKRTAAMI